MEKRFWIGVILLLLLLAAGISVALGMEALHKPGVQMLAQARDLALDGDFAQAVRLSREAEHLWQDGWPLAAAAADHSPMDEIDQLFAELDVYARAEDVAHFAACCGQLSVLLGAMYNAHSLTLWNLL